jgi:hypothetical protein
MKTLLGIGLGVAALLSVAALTEKDEYVDLQSDERCRKHAWPDAPAEMDETELEAHWYQWAA